MAKNIIVCCDGTGNQFGEKNSNVVKLFSVLEYSQGEQVLYYNPGVGTMSDPGLKTSIGKKVSVALGLTFGNGFARNVANAYAYLMENYDEGDRIFLFGFSRGAYTVKVLAGFLHLNGLLFKGCENLIPYSWKLYGERDWSFAAKFKKNYARTVQVHFLGVWDAVSSIGWITKRKTYPHTFQNPSVLVIRHAVSIDERRAYYEANLFREDTEVKSNVKQVWFAGVHSDVGGSYPEEESGLSKIPLMWMIQEAKEFGLKIKIDRYNKVVLGEGKSDYVKPDHLAPIHQSLTGLWWILEYLPKNHILNRREFRFNLGKRRPIPENSTIHQSVIARIKEMNYAPSNLPSQYKVV